MELTDRNVLITGGASGIGAELGRHFARAGAKKILLADINAQGAQRVASEIGEVAEGAGLDVTDRSATEALVDRFEAQHGPISIFCCNAGIGTMEPVVDTNYQNWQRVFEVNVMSQVVAADVMIPRWKARAEGYLVVTASAAGLLTMVGDAAYSATKHAAVGLAEWIAITHATDGVRVSCLCPQGVNTPMVHAAIGANDGTSVAGEVLKAFGIIEPSAVAEAVLDAIAAERFLILPHPEVARFEQGKVADRDKWIARMQPRT